MNSFDYLLNIGASAEKEVKKHLETRGHIITDVSHDKSYQSVDIDFVMRSPQGQTATLEVKHDSKLKKTGNIFIEWAFDRKTGLYKGWGQKCEADYICFYDADIRTGYIFDWYKLKQYTMQNGKQISWYNSSDNCEGYAYLLPLSEAKLNSLLIYEWRN